MLAASLFSALATVNSLASEGAEFFEQKIRPVLAERCYQCHSATSQKLKGGLHLDSREGALKGGDTRSAIIPGDPEKSLLIEAIRYENTDLQMPPKKKLTESEISDFCLVGQTRSACAGERHRNRERGALAGGGCAKREFKGRGI